MRDRGRDRETGPAAPTAPPEIVQAVRLAVENHQGDRGPLMVMLHDIQATLGCIPSSAVPLLADALNLSRADVYGVVTFYKDFRAEPAGRRTVRICRAEACQSVGSEELVDRATQRLGVGLGDTTGDGAVTLEQVFCFGNCALGPSVEVDGRLYGRVDAARLESLLTAGPSHG
jgi:formate dehydrogenase subunit gamma